MNRMIKHSLWHLKRSLRSLGWPSAAGAFLLMCCVAAWLLVLRPLDARIGVLERQAQAMRKHSTVTVATQVKTPSSAEQLVQFYNFFPPKSDLSDCVAKIYEIAAHTNLNLEQGDYRLAHERDSNLARYDIVLPVRGPYVPIRKFIAQVLQDVPNLALEGITFNRQKVNDAAVDAQIRFVLYLGDL